jgi:hypothetical protein
VRRRSISAAFRGGFSESRAECRTVQILLAGKMGETAMKEKKKTNSSRLALEKKLRCIGMLPQVIGAQRAEDN